MEEVLVDAYVGRHENQDGEDKSRLMIEMHPNLPEGNSCVLVPLMVDAAISTMVPVHEFNPHSYWVVIRHDSMYDK